MPQPRRAAERAMGATLPPPQVRTAIAEAVHQVVTAWIDGPGGKSTGTPRSRACATYAMVGARVAGDITGRTYIPVLGAVLVEIGPAPDPRQMVSLLFGAERVEDFDARQTPALSVSAGSYHAWIAGALTRSTVEIVDLTTRHFPTWGKEHGTPWGWPPPPRHLWVAIPEMPLIGPGFFPGFPGMLLYRADDRATAAIEQEMIYVPVADLVARATAAVRARLGGMRIPSAHPPNASR